jgi:hypothetical protein
VTEALRLLAGIALPWLVGAAWVGCRWQPGRPGRVAVVLGYGYLVGILATTFLMRLWELLQLSQDLTRTVAALLLLGALGLWLGRRERGVRSTTPAPAVTEEWRRPDGVILALSVVLLVRFTGLGLELTHRPMSSWDAWAIWSPRARVWHELGRLVPFVGEARWLQQEGAGLYTGLGWHYPPTVPLVQLWTGLTLGRWDESLLNVHWLACAAALGLGFFGQARLWGMGPRRALLATYFLLSLPLLDAQLALAGQADLWMAAVLGLASLAFYHWVRSGDPRQAVLGLVLVVSGTQIKMPGYLWLATFLPPLAALRWRLPALVATLALGGAALVAFPMAGVLRELASVREQGLFARGEAGAAISSSLLVDGRWHLLWYGLGGVALWALRTPRRSEAGRAMALHASTLVSALLAVYLFTPRAEWAIDQSQFSRAALHPVPALLFAALAAWHARSGREGTGVDASEPESTDR